MERNPGAIEMALGRDASSLSGLISHELHFFVSFRSAPCPRRCALAGPRGCARWRRRAPPRAGSSAPCTPCSLGALRTTICVSLQSGAWRRAGRGRGRRRPEALPVNVLPGVSSLVAHCPPPDSRHTHVTAHTTHETSHTCAQIHGHAHRRTTHTHTHIVRGGGDAAHSYRPVDAGLAGTRGAYYMYLAYLLA